MNVFEQALALIPRAGWREASRRSLLDGAVRIAKGSDPPPAVVSLPHLPFPEDLQNRGWTNPTDAEALAALQFLATVEQGLPDEYRQMLQHVIPRVEQWYPKPPSGGRPTNDYVIMCRLIIGYRVRRWSRVLKERYCLTSGTMSLSAVRRVKRFGIYGPTAPQTAALQIVERETDIPISTLQRYASEAKDLPLT